MKAIGSLFGGGDGPSAEEIKARELAEKNQKELERRRADEEAAKDSQLRLLRGLQGRGGKGTAFEETGTRGVSETLG